MNDQENNDKPGFLDPDKNLLWKLYLKRKDAFVAMNKDIDEVVNQCLISKRHLEAVDDSNRNLKQQVRALRSTYEGLLEKNRKDTGIIMRLKDSESLFKKALKNERSTNESLKEIQIKNKEKSLDRKLLQDERDKLVFRSQVLTNDLRKKNLRHKKLYELILEENKKYKENDNQFVEETQQLKYIMGKNDGILSKWLKDNAERDAAIRRLQDEMKAGLIISVDEKDNDEGVTEETATDVVDESSDNAENLQSSENKNADESSKSLNIKSKTPEVNRTGKQDSKEIAFQKEWLAKKILFEVAENQKEHFMDFYMIINKRIQDLNTEIVNVREWLLDRMAEKREIWDKASAMEKLVSEKRRQKPVPLRTSIDEIKIWIDVQREANDALRKIAYKCLSAKLDDSAMYSEYSSVIRNMYLNTLKEQQDLMENEAEKGTFNEKQGEDKT